eukprot:m.770714 g.770714  ORF g.770714 m.770714 type:complete len:405 (-) comp23241_c0_seq13:654-1868(-)
MAGILDWVGETLFGDDNADKGEPAPEGAAIEPQEEDVVYPDNMISKEHLYDMFSSFSAMVESEDGKRRLKDAVAEGKAVEDVTSQMQVEIAEKLGLDGNHVTDMFKHVLKVYKDDEVLCEQFIKFCEKESLACDEAELGPEKLQEKLAKIDLEAAAASQHGHDQHGHGAGRPMSSVGMAQQLAMLSQTPEELDATFQMIERNLREVMSSNAQMKDMILSQLSKSGQVSGDTDAISATMAKLRQGQDILKASVQEEAKAKGSTMEAVLQEKLEHLSRLRQADDLHGHSGHGHEHGEGCNHSHGEHGHSHDGPVPASPYTEGMRLRFKVCAAPAALPLLRPSWLCHHGTHVHLHLTQAVHRDAGFILYIRGSSYTPGYHAAAPPHCPCEPLNEFVTPVAAVPAHVP